MSSPTSTTNRQPSGKDLEVGTLRSKGERLVERDSRRKSGGELEESRRISTTKVMIGLLLLGFVIFVIVDSTTNKHLRDALTTFLEWIEDNPIPGMFAFMLVYFIATVLFIPGSLLSLGAGFVFANAFGLGFGLLIGTVAVFVGAFVGAIAAFLLGRYLLRNWVAGLATKYAIFEALDIAMKEKGFRIMVLLRLSPIIPFNATNYIGGVTSISLRTYTLSLFAILPWTIVYVFLGASAGSLTDSVTSGESTAVTIAIVGIGSVLGVITVVLTSYYAKVELNRVVAAREQQKAESQASANVVDGAVSA